MEEKEKVITATDILDFVAGLILIIAGIVALFALIWAAWHTFKVALSVAIGTMILCAAGEYIHTKLHRNAGSRD